MYSRHEASNIRKKFWVSFGQYLAPIPSAAGEKINWINYKTGTRFIHFKMDVVDEAYIGIEISHDNPGDREMYYDQLMLLITPFEKILGEKWLWEEQTNIDEERSIARIYTKLENVNIYNTEDWPAIISFLKPRLVNLDCFWQEYRMVFEMIDKPGM